MYEYEIQCNHGFGDGWECEHTEETLAAAKRSLREYQENQKAPVRIKRVKVQTVPK